MKIDLTESIYKLKDAIMEKNGGRLQVLEEEIQSLMRRERDLLCAPDDSLKKFGPKFENLIKMSRLIKGLDLTGFEVLIPMGFVLDVDISRPWEALRELFDGGNFFERHDVKALLNEIVQKIAQAPLEISPEFEAWLHHCKGYLMVRSSGMEDLSECSNAGGNLSLAYVPPEREPFCKAAKEVITSYYLKDSLQNQINAGLNPFALSPPLAVIAQEVIGEPFSNQNPEEIPTSLVLFTTEPLYVGEEHFRFMRISASWGHGQAVVEEAGVGTDTIYLLVSDANPSELSIYYDNADKPQRLAPVEGEGLQLVDNPASMRHQPALSSELLARLYTWGVAAEAFFDGQPTDMEIVIKKGVIFPVQARRLKRQKLSPTYFAGGGAPFLKAQTIVPGKANAVAIDSLKELRLAANLKIAEQGYEKQKAVIVLYPEPANSHPVVNFSNLAITCLYTKEAQKVVELAKKFTPQQQAVICSQTGNVHLLPKGDISRFIHTGFTAHPAVFRNQGKLPLEIESALQNGAFDPLREHFDAAVKEVDAATGLKRLYRIKVLEALVLERIAAEPRLKSARELALYQKKFERPVKYSDLYLLGDCAIEPSSTQMWRDFLEKIEPFEEQPRLRKMMSILERSGMLPIWFAFFFKGRSAEEVLGTLPPQDDRKIQQLMELHASIKALRGNGFAARKSFTALQKRLELLVKRIEEGHLSQYMEGTSPVTRLILFNILEDIVELHDLAIKQMKGSPDWKPEEKVPLFRKMLHTYHALLKCCVNELKPTIVNAQEGEWEYQYQDCLSVQMLKREDYFSKLQDNSPAQLEPSRDYSVGGDSIGSNAIFQGGNDPQTLEDFFALIHTDLTQVIAHFKNKEIGFHLLEDANLPPFLHEHLFIKQSGFDYFQRTKTGINITDSWIEIKYVIPLRHHAAQIALKYEKGSGEITLKCAFYGLPQYGRWTDIALNATIFHDLGIFILNAPILLAKSELKLEWKVRNPEEIEKIFQEIVHLGKISCILHPGDLGIGKKFDRILPHIAPAALVPYLLEKLKEEVTIDVGYIPASDREHLIKSILCCPQLVEAGKSDLENAAIALVESKRSASAFEAVKPLLKSGCPQRLVDLVIAIAVEHPPIALEILTTVVKSKLSFPLHIALKHPSMELMTALVENGYDCLDEAEAVANKSPKLLCQLVKRGRCYGEALKDAKEHIELFYALIEQRQFMAEAESFARALCGSESPKKIVAGLRLYQSLDFDIQALEQAKLRVYDSDAHVRSEALWLFQKLVERGRYYEEALKAATEGFGRKLDPFPVGALFQSLLQKGVGFEQFLTLLDTKDLDLIGCLQFLIDNFFASNPPPEQIERVLNKIKSFLLINHRFIRENGLVIFRKFMEKGYGTPQVLELIQTPNYYEIYLLFLSIYNAHYNREAIELIKKGIGNLDVYKETLILYQRVADSVPPEVENQLLALPKKVRVETYHIEATCNMFKEIVRRRGKFEEALEAATGWLRNYNADIRKKGVELFAEILAAKNGFKEAYQNAMEMIKEKEEHKLVAVGLINALIKNGYRFSSEDAKSILFEISKSTEAVREESLPIKRHFTKSKI